MFFRKACAERPACKILCIAPGGQDKLIIMNQSSSDVISSVVINAINACWSYGISKAKQKTVNNEQLIEIKLNGYPWFSTGDESVNCRKLLAAIVQNVSKIGWKFLAGVNLKGGTDSLFFIQKPHEVNSSLLHDPYTAINF